MDRLVWTLALNLFGISLYFDGSIKHPSDPNFPVALLGKVSSCAAAVILEPEANESSKRSTILSGKLLAEGSARTSAEAEYEGLILGLELLSNLLACHSEDTPPCRISTPQSIHVYGDCKMVMQQMQGRSRPRKMETEYQRAMDLLNQIPAVSWNFQHVPRAENELCDRLCAKIVMERTEQARAELENDVRALSSQSKVVDSTISATTPISIDQVLHRHFQNHQSLVPFSQRPKTYQTLAEIARACELYKDLTMIGERIELEAKTIWTKAGTIPPTMQTDLVSLGILYQIEGLLGLQRDKKAHRLSRKHKVLLSNGPEHTITELSSIWDKYSKSNDLQASWPTMVQSWSEERNQSRKGQDCDPFASFTVKLEMDSYEQ